MWWATVEDKRNDGMDTSRGLTDHDPTGQSSNGKAIENDHARFLKQAMS